MKTKRQHPRWTTTKKTRKRVSKTTMREKPVIKEFKELLLTHPVERMYMERMITSIPKLTPAQRKANPPPKDVDDLLNQLNSILSQAPDFNTTLSVGTPISALLVWTMGSSYGFDAYRRVRINAMFKKILAVYKKFLDSPESRYVLTDKPNGWFSPAALKKLDINQYIHDPKAKYFGFKSWNDFFTRRLKPGMRPIADPDDNKVIVSACDSTVYRIRHNVKRFSKFWLKSQPYSLHDMLANDEHYVNKFVGGTVYQAFLNPFNYHRWHSPIDGTIEKAFVQPGYYFVQSEEVGEDPTIQDGSEAYLTNIQTRALIYIKADHSPLGTVCVMPTGMIEISSCNIHPRIKPGYKVKKGEELGYFAYGGSTHCVFYEPGVLKEILPKKDEFVKMGTKIAIAK
jgi:phosphatidylserine decarboxylase